MANPPYADTVLIKLRDLVEVVERELHNGITPAPALAAAWTELVDLMALGTAPETRICPSCKTVGMRAASRCGTCWIELEKLPQTAATTTSTSAVSA